MTNLDMSAVEADADNPPVPREQKLRELSGLVSTQTALEDRLEMLEDQAKKAKERIKQISEVQIPEIMQSIGVRQFTLTNGFKITVKPWYNMTPKEENIAAAYDWLDGNGHGDIVKHSLTLEVRLTQANLLGAIKALADEGQISRTEKNAIHHMTAGSWVKGQLESGQPIPRELLGVTTGFKTKIERVKK